MAAPAVAQFHRLVVRLIQGLPAGRVRSFKAWNRLVGGFTDSIEASTIWGARMLCDPRDFVPQMILCFGVWEPQVSAAIRSALHPGDLFVDIGANIGYHTLLAADAVGPGGSVVAIEASPSIFARLQRNIALNGLDQVRPVCMAVAETAGVLDFYRAPGDNSGRSGTSGGDGHVLEARVPAAPLHEILTPAERARIALIKIDIEGGEVEVVRNILDNLHLYPARMGLLVEISPNGAWPDQFRRMLAAGFEAHAIRNSYSLRSYIDGDPDASGPVRLTDLPAEQIDVLFTRRPN